MKSIYIFLSSLFILFFYSVQDSVAQDNEWVNQVILANSGKFESSPPFIDFVTMQKYDPASHNTSTFNTIFTQSAQDIVIFDHFAYVAAQDSIIKYNLDTYQRVAAVADSGMSKLAIYYNKLLISKQWPVTRFFLEVLDLNLALLARVDGISGDCGGVTANKDSVFVAVNEGWLGQEGKLAVVNTNNWTLAHEVNFGTNAVGISNIYNYNATIFTVNKTPFGGSNQGSITAYTINNGNFINKILGVKVGDGAGISGNLLFVGLNGGIGSYNLDTQSIADTTIIPDPSPGSHSFSILSSTIDYVNNHLYANIGNSTNNGICVVASTTGDSLTSFTTGISTDAIAVDYRTPVGIQNEGTIAGFINIYPNPANHFVRLTFTGEVQVTNVKLHDLTGRILYSSILPGNERSFKINCENYSPGIYILSLATSDGPKTMKFIKK